jgi:hypothetical protein
VVFVRVFHCLSLALLVPALLLAAPKGYVATVNEDVASCLKEVKAIRGVSSAKGLHAVGIITFKASAAAAAKVGRLDCIASVEEELTATTQGDCSTEFGE